jgi:hypothetical protein
LTTLEMLDALEAGLLVLRTTNENLVAELQQANRQRGSSPASSRRTKRKTRGAPAKRARSTAKKGEAVKVLEQPHRPAAESEERSLGKRRALGRSILQLRKPAVPTAAVPASPADEGALFQRERPKADESE